MKKLEIPIGEFTDQDESGSDWIIRKLKEAGFDPQIDIIYYEDITRDVIVYKQKEVESDCDYCRVGKPLVNGNSSDQGIAIQYPDKLMAYGYDVHGMGGNALIVHIKHCPMCGRKLEVCNEEPNLGCEKI